MQVEHMVCRSCDLTMEGEFEVPTLAQLSLEDQLFVGFCCKVWDHARESVGWTSLRGQFEHLVD